MNQLQPRLTSFRKTDHVAGHLLQTVLHVGLNFRDVYRFRQVCQYTPAYILTLEYRKPQQSCRQYRIFVAEMQFFD